MSALALIEVQKALFNKLSADGVLMGMVSGVYDAVPQKTALPYVTIGNAAQRVEPSDSAEITECRFDIHAWTAAPGRKSALTILSRIFGLLHLGTITVANFNLVALRVEQSSVQVTEENTRVDGLMVVQVTVEEA